MSASDRVTNVVVAGIGGQGVLKASDILAEVAFARGIDVKKSEVHGMSQRGGSVTSEVRFGAKVDSPMVPFGETDVLVVLSQDQIEVVRPLLRAQGVLVEPADVDVGALATKRSLNVALLGVASAHLPFDTAEWIAAIERVLHEKLWKVNREAFGMGRATTLSRARTRGDERHV
jgi:indolepyruvate ferredoxin oxidoreductase beta subunit